MSAIQQVLLGLTGVTGGETGEGAKWNPADSNPAVVLSNSNRTAAATTIATAARGMESHSTGIWQFEVLIDDVGASGSLYIGYGGSLASLDAGPGVPSAPTGASASVGYRFNGTLWNRAEDVRTGLETWTTGDVVGVLIDVPGDRQKFYKNGALVVDLSLSAGLPSTVSAPFFPMVGDGGANSTWRVTLNHPLTYPIPGAGEWA